MKQVCFAPKQRYKAAKQVCFVALSVDKTTRPTDKARDNSAQSGILSTFVVDNAAILSIIRANVPLNNS
jgi:hypothetical protein